MVAISTRSLLLSVASLLLLTFPFISAQTTTWYWSYTELPYYTWNSEWYECASGTLTSSSATANFDGSFLATNITGTRYFYNTTGAYSNVITGLSTYAIADNRFWPTGNALGLPTLTSDGLSYTVNGVALSVYGPQGSNINMYLQGANAATGQIVEGDEPGGDVLAYLNISSNPSGIATCPSTAPQVQTWSWIYTQQNSDNSYVCASGHMTTWIAYTNGSYQIEDVQGIRYLYSPTRGQQATGIVGVSQPYSNGGNTNLVYPGNGNNGASSVDAGGLAVNLNTKPAFGASFSTSTSSTLLIRNSGGQVTELGSTVTVSSSTFQIVAWSPTFTQCNMSSALANNPSQFPSSAYTTYYFIYTIQPYYTWDSEWSVCTTGSMLVYSANNNSDSSYNLMALQGNRRYSKNGVTTNQAIVELIAPGNYEGNDNKIWINPALNGGFSVDLAGISYNVNGTALFTNGGPNGAAVNIYQAFDYSGYATYLEYDNNNAPLDTTGQFSIGTTAYTCPAANTNLQTTNFMYTVQSATAGQFAACVVGSLQYSTPNIDGGLQILNIAGLNGNNGATRYTYNTLGVASQGIEGVARVNFNGYSNNNELYTAGGNFFKGDGFVFNMYEPIQVAGNFSSAFSVGITYINGAFVEYEPVTGPTASTNAPYLTGTFSFGAADYTCPTTTSSFGITQSPAVSGTQTVYFSYVLAPYYTWDSEWSVCASGSITANLQQNADYSYTATNVVGVRRFANNSGAYYQTITGSSPYDGADNNFWLSKNAYNVPPVDLGGFSYQLDSNVLYPLDKYPSTGTSTLNTVNFFMIQSPWPSAPNWFNTPSLSLAEADGPTGDVYSNAVFSLTQSDVGDCTQAGTGSGVTIPIPQTQVWQFYYTQALGNSYVCGSGQLTTWLPQKTSNGQGYLVIDAHGFRVFYDAAGFVLGNQYVFTSGIDGMFGPVEWNGINGQNDNFIYPSASGTPKVLDANGLLMIASPVAYFSANYESNFIELVSNGNVIYEFLDNTTTPGTSITSTFQLWPYGSSGVLACNTTTPPSSFPAHVYYAFQYVITPYYTWSGYWSVCAQGVITAAGWNAADYVGAVPSGNSYTVLGISGTRTYFNNGQATTLNIIGLSPPYSDASNTNMIYTQSMGLDAGGLTYLVSGMPTYENGFTGPSEVTIYNQFTTPQLAVYELNSNDPYGFNTEGTINFTSVSSANAAVPSSMSCASLTVPEQRSYAFLYTINSTTPNSNWQVCASGQMWTNYVAADGGQLVMEVRGSRYFNYPASTYYSAFIQAFTGMSAPGTYGNNDNVIYPNGKAGAPAQMISANGVLVNTGYGVTQFVNGPSPYTTVKITGFAGSNAVYEFAGPQAYIQSSFTVTPYNAAGQNPTCKAPYSPSVPTQTVYFSYTLAFTGGSVGASGVITATSTANSDGSYTALWITGFRYYVSAGVYTNATITGLAPQAQNFAGGLTGDQHVFITSGSNIVSTNGLFYMTDNVNDQLAGNQGDGSAWIQLLVVGGQLTETGATGPTSSGVTSSSGIVSANPSAVVQYGNTAVNYGAGMEQASPSTGGILPSRSSSSSSSSGGAGMSSGISSGISSSSSGGAGNGNGGQTNASTSSGISNGAIAGAVIGSVIGAAILCLICFFLLGFLGGKSKKGSEMSSTAGPSSRFTPMEESRGASQMEMSSAARTGEAETV